MARRVLLYGAQQTQLIERGQAQVIDQAPDILQGCGAILFDLPEQRLSRLRVRLDQGAGRADFKGLGGQRRTEPIVQIAPDTPAFLFPG